MFVVYSPEGRVYLGIPHPTPALKANAVPPVPPVKKSSLDPDQVETDRRYQQVPLSIEQARKHYEAVRRAAAERGEPLVEVREIMSHPVISIEATASLEAAWLLFEEKGVGNLPVLAQSRLVGMLSVTDLIGHVWHQQQGVQVRSGQVSDYMSSPVVSCWPGTLIRRAAAVMSDYLIHALPVVSQAGTLEGMVTVSDLVWRLAVEPPLEVYA